MARAARREKPASALDARSRRVCVGYVSYVGYVVVWEMKFESEISSVEQRVQRQRRQSRYFVRHRSLAPAPLNLFAYFPFQFRSFARSGSSFRYGPSIWSPSIYSLPTTTTTTT